MSNSTGTPSAGSELRAAIEAIAARFRSGNRIPIDKATVPAEEWHALVAAIRHVTAGEPLHVAYEQGWHEASEWANRPDLHADVDSGEYARRREIRLRGLAASPPPQATAPAGSADVLKNAAQHLLDAMNFRDACVLGNDIDKARFAVNEVFKARDALRDALADAPASDVVDQIPPSVIDNAACGSSVSGKAAAPSDVVLDRIQTWLGMGFPRRTLVAVYHAATREIRDELDKRQALIESLLQFQQMKSRRLARMEGLRLETQGGRKP